MASHSQPWTQFHHPLVRDLVWAVCSPALICSDINDIHCPVDVLEEHQLAYLKHLDSEPSALLSWMTACKSSRLGLRFEALWQFWLTRIAHIQSSGNGPAWEHRFNLQVHSSPQELQQKTLGELDSVSYCDTSKTLIHRELAVKFYLGVDSHLLPEEMQPDFPFCWVGPNVKDRLDLKTKQILYKQLNLLRDNSEAKAALPGEWHWQTLQRQAIVRGRLFYPINTKAPSSGPSIMAPQHLRGYWLPRSLLEYLSHDKWIVLNRQQWFAPIEIENCPQSDQNLLNRSQLSATLDDYFAENRQPLQLAAVELNNSHWLERERYFLVPDQWPSIT